MRKVLIDFETYSGHPINVGSVKYVHHPDADIVCLGYKIDDEKTQLWRPGLPVPEVFYDKATVFYAHNALFDYLVWHVLGNKYTFPAVDLPRWIDTQALANRYSLPGALATVGDILKVSVQKDKKGKQLIKQICCPDVNGQRPTASNNDLLDFYDYCIQDVDSMYHLVKALPSDKLAPLEQEFWVLTQEMNLEGLPVDEVIVDKILTYIETFAEEMTRRVPEITNRAVEKVTQVQRMVKYINSRGVDVSNLQAGTVDKLLSSEIPDDVRELLVLRQTIGRSSTAKYRKIKEMAYAGRVFNNLQYYGAATGRWTGRGFQLHNLPRASVQDPESYITSFDNFEPVNDPVNIAKALIRPMIRTGPEEMLLVSDYSAIENRILMWIADEQEALQLLKDGKSQYIDMAAYMYNYEYSDIQKGTIEYQVGKIVILGCGFQMGGKRFKENAETYDVFLSEGESYNAVNAYRSKYPKVKKMWSDLSKSAINAIRYPGRVYETNKCSFRVVKCRAGNRWLMLTLPSGRSIYYMDPHLSDDTYGVVPGHMGTNPYTKKWSRLKLIPGRITENIAQGTARDIMGQGLLNIKNKMKVAKLLGSVHDEGLAKINKAHIDDTTIEVFNRHLCDMPAWADGLPLEAEGWIGPRYKK
jgi:DNA polymerase